MAERIIGRLTYKIVGDDRQFQKALKKSVRDLDKTADRLQQIGGRLSTFVTAPILAAGGAALKAASDLEESLNAVNVVFGDSADQIEDWGENAATQAGLARSEFNDAAVRIGASLKNAGVPMDQVAGSTINLTQRAADLASVFNTDVNDALTAIQAALRGEADPIERFGASVNAATVEAKALELGLADTKAEITDQIKVQARLAVIMDQTAQVAGDFANTSDSMANATRITKAEVIDLAAELGQELLPIAQTVITNVLELVREFKDLDDTQKQNIIRIAAVAAAMGPLTAGVGTAIKAVNALRLAFIALSANPIVLAIGGLTAGVVALGLAMKNISDEQHAKDMERYADAAEQAGVSVNQIANDHRMAQTALKQQLQYGTDLETAIANIAEDYSLTRTQVVALARELDGYVDGQEDVLNAIEDQNAAHDEQKEDMEQLRTLQEEKAQFAAAERADQEAMADAARQRAAAERAALEAQRQARSEAWAETLTEYYQTQEGQLEILQQELAQYQEALNNPDSDLGVRTERGRQVVQAIIRDLEEQIARQRESLGLVGEQNDALEQSRQTSGNLLFIEQRRVGTAQDLTKEITDFEILQARVRRDAEDWASEYQDLASGAADAWAGVMQGLGQAIADTEGGLKSVGQAMVSMFTGILNTLGAQFAAMAAAAAFGMPPTFIPNPAQAAGYGAASAGFYAASGLVSAITAFGEGGSFFADQPQAIVVGDKPEMVDIRPVDHAAPPGWGPSGGGITIQGDVYGYEDFARKVEQASSRAGRTGRVGR